MQIEKLRGLSCSFLWLPVVALAACFLLASPKVAAGTALVIGACSCSSLDGCSCSVSAEDLTIPGSFGFADDTGTLEWSFECTATTCSLMESGGNNVLSIESGSPSFAFNADNTTTCLMDEALCVDNAASSNSLVIDGNGRVGVGTPIPTADLDVEGDARFGGTFSVASSRDVKQAFERVDSRQILDRLLRLSVTEWSYRADEQSARHVGPVAEEFHAAFKLGRDDKHVSPTDLSGVAFAAIQGLYELLRERDEEIARLRRNQLELRWSRDDLQERLMRLEALTTAKASHSPAVIAAPH